MTPLVSVIIPAYNAETYILETLDSVFKQSWKNIEVIVVNDGSTDSTEKLLIEFVNAGKIKYFSQENSGSPAAKNLGLKNAKGEYVQFLDADDLLSENKIEEQVRALQEQPGKVAICRTKWFENSNEISRLSEKNEIDTKSLFSTDDTFRFLMLLNGAEGKKGMVQTNAYLTPMAIIDKAGYWEEALSRSPDDDSEFFSRVLLKAEGVVYVPGAINYYRKLRGQISLSKQVGLDHIDGALRTVQLKVKLYLARQNSGLVRSVAAGLYASFIYQYYNSAPQLGEIAFKEIAILKTKTPLKGGRYFQLIARIIGFKNAIRLKKQFIS